MIIDKILSNKSIKNGIESGKDYGRFYMGDSGRTGFEESGQSGRGEISGDDPCKGYQPDHRLYPRWLYGNRHEKAV